MSLLMNPIKQIVNKQSVLLILSKGQKTFHLLSHDKFTKKNHL